VLSTDVNAVNGNWKVGVEVGAAYLDMKGSSYLITTLGLHGLYFSPMKCMKSQMLDFVIFLSEKVQDIIVEQLTKFSKMIIHGGTSRVHEKSPMVVWDR